MLSVQWFSDYSLSAFLCFQNVELSLAMLSQRLWTPFPLEEFTSAPPKCSLSGPCSSRDFESFNLGWSWLSHRDEFHPSECAILEAPQCFRLSNLPPLLMLFIPCEAKLMEFFFFPLEREASTSKELLCFLNHSK